MELTEIIEKLKEKSAIIIKKGALFGLGAYLLFHLTSNNGLLDSNRTKETGYLNKPSNQVKQVVHVDEEWRDNKIYSLDLTGYNPKVIRHVQFSDGTETTLNYRTLAWQPFRKWMSGEEFEPKKGEQYEVTQNNAIVKKIR